METETKRSAEHEPGEQPPQLSASESVTWFILPFRYGRTSASAPATGSPRYKQRPATELPGYDARSRYLTRETESTLFERAAWFQLKEGESEGLWSRRFTWRASGDRPLQVTLHEVEVVLFELANKQSPPEMRVGFLMIKASLQEGAAPDDLLRFNEWLRFHRRPYPGHEVMVSGLLEPFVAAVGAKGLSGADPDALYGAVWKHLLNLPRLVNDTQFEVLAGNPDSPTDCYDDERAFVWTAWVMPQGIPTRAPERVVPVSQLWVDILNVNEPAKEPSSFMTAAVPFEQAWADRRTYMRWAHKGTHYGFTSHSGAVLLRSSAPEGVPVLDHWQQMYRDQSILLLYVRTVTLSFRYSLAEFSASLVSRRPGNGSSGDFSTDPKRLRDSFTHFTNLYRFPLLSNQQQGLELYEKARDAFDVTELFDELRVEIEQTQSFLAAREGEALSRTANRLTVGAAFLGVASLLLAWAQVELACKNSLGVVALILALIGLWWMFAQGEGRE